MCLIELKGATKCYGSKQIIHNFDWSFKSGTLTVFKGQNGSGKSTLMKICMERTKLDKGVITVKNNLKCRYMPDFVELPYQEKPLKFIKWMLSIMKVGIDLKLLSELDIDLEHPVEHLSKGNKQKLLLYLALVGRPDVVYLDEPFTALDIKSIKCVEKRIIQLMNEGTCLLVCSHEKNLFKSIKHEVIDFDAFNML
ncbi:MAG: ATP-binding cassette domain-containing protein [Acholeplasma sp.]|nr:ATP-binding cassette domain-containing protein [Acholeplasma sp.]